MTNPKMQTGTRVDFRRWQIMANHQGDFPYGECPKCGQVGNPTYDNEPTGEENLHRDWFECEDCGISYYYEVTHAYRYGGIEK